jgi:hypothetical protein
LLLLLVSFLPLRTPLGVAVVFGAAVRGGRRPRIGVVGGVLEMAYWDPRFFLIPDGDDLT